MTEPKRYEIHKYAVALLSLSLNVAVLAYMLSSGATFRLRDWAHGSVLVYALVFGALLQVLHLPLRFYSGFILEHRFGLSRLTVFRWLKDEVIGAVVGGAFALAGLEVIYYLMRTYPQNWWIYAACCFVAFAVLLTNLAPVVLLPLFFKFKPVQNPELQRRVEELSHRTNTRVRGIFEWALGEKTRKANAAVVGWGNTRRIIVSDTLLADFSADEIEVIMAHELCHHVRNHIWLSIALQGALTFAGFFLLRWSLERFGPDFGFMGVADIAGLPFLMLVTGALSIAAMPIVNGFSRRLEREADLYALDLTDDSLAFVSSMERLGRLNMANESPHPVIEFIFYSHPSIEKRVRMAADRVGQIV